MGVVRKLGQGCGQIDGGAHASAAPMATANAAPLPSAAVFHLNEVHCLSVAEGMEVDGEEGGGAGPSSTQKQRKGERGQAWYRRGGWRFAAFCLLLDCQRPDML